LLVLLEDDFDRLLTRGELGGNVHQLARLGGSLAAQFAHRVATSDADEERVMLRRYFHKAGPPAGDGKGQDNNKKEDDKEVEFPEVHGSFMIFGGQVANASARHRKQERREVCSVKVATPVYLD
jgi:hypothetical protein